MDFIKKLNELDLQTSDYFMFCKIIDRIPLKQILGFKVPLNIDIYRIRPSEKTSFSHSSDISYNPSPRNYGRAHRPFLPMFYGAIKTQKDELPIVTNFGEVNQILRNKGADEGEQRLTVGIWTVQKEFPAVLLIFNDEYLNKMPQFQKLYYDYANDKNNLNDLTILEYFAKEYAKEINNGEYNYKISAAFTEIIILKFNIGAIVYPSVRMGGESFNIAIRSEYIDYECLRLRAVLETVIYYKNKVVVNDYLRETKEINDDGSFELVKINDLKKHLGRERTLKMLNEILKDNNNRKPYRL